MKKIIKLLCSLAIVLPMLALPIKAEENITIFSDYYYMVDMDNGQVILDHGSEEMIYPASMTKMMTLIVAIENIQNQDERVILDKEVFQGLYEANASLAGFNLNESVTLKDCLYGLFLPSGAETTRALAINVAGSEEAYVELMNQKAIELNMQNTHFVNTTGLHDNDHKTTLRDLATLLEYCMQNPQFEEIFTTRKYVAQSGSMHTNGINWESSMFKNIRTISKDGSDRVPILGGKTGYTIPAGLCLASIGEQDGRRYMLITAHAPAGSTPYHVIDAVNIYDTVFNSYTKNVLVTSDQILGESEVRFNFSNSKVNFLAEKEIELTLPGSIDVSQLQTHLSVLERYDAPIAKGEILGTATLMFEGNPVYSFNLVSQKDIGRNPLLYGAHITWQWMMNNLILTGIILFIIGFLLWRVYLYRLEIKDKIRKKAKIKRRRYRL